MNVEVAEIDETEHDRERIKMDLTEKRVKQKTTEKGRKWT